MYRTHRVCVQSSIIRGVCHRWAFGGKNPQSPFWRRGYLSLKAPFSLNWLSFITVIVINIDMYISLKDSTYPHLDIISAKQFSCVVVFCFLFFFSPWREIWYDNSRVWITFRNCLAVKFTILKKLTKHQRKSLKPIMYQSKRIQTNYFL